MTQKKPLELGTDSIYALLLKFSIPAIFGLFISASYNLIDRIFIGNGVGSLGLAGIAVCFPIVSFQMAFGLMIGVGGSVNFAVSLGEKKRPRAECFFLNALFLILAVSIAFTLIIFFFLDELLLKFGATEAIFPYAKTYLSITLLGNVFLMTKIVLNNFIRASGAPKYAMFSLFIGAVINTILDALFIFYFKWGIAGAAYATILAQAISFCWSACYFLFKSSPYSIRIKKNFLSFKFLFSICAVGIAPFLIQSTTGLMQGILNITLIAHGNDVAVSVMGVTMAVAMVLFMPVIGLCEGAQPIVGFNLGAKNYLRLLQLLKITIILSMSCFLFCTMLVMFFAPNIITIFNKQDEELIRIGARALRLICACLPLVGLSFSISFFLQAVKNPKMSAFLALSRQILFLIPCFFILPRYFGLNGVFLSFPVADFISFFIAVPVTRHQFKKYKRLEEQKNQQLKK